MRNALPSFIRRRHQEAGQATYWEDHLVSVARTVPNDLVFAALAHDVLEDTDTTADDLIAAGMTVREVEIVDLMTKRPGQSLEEYIERLRVDHDAIRVKLADVMNNVGRLHQLPQDDRLRLTDKYFRTLQLLAGAAPQPMGEGLLLRELESPHDDAVGS